MSRVEQMGEVLSELEEQHPMLPLKAAFEYAEAILDGKPIPLPDAADAAMVARWASRMPAVVAYVDSAQTLHAIREIRRSGTEWGMHIELGTAKQTYEILRGEQSGRCDSPGCNQKKGHPGACLYKMSNHISVDQSSITGPQEPRLIDVLRSKLPDGPGS